MAWIAIYRTADGVVEEVTETDPEFLDLNGREYVALPDHLQGCAIRVIDGRPVENIEMLRVARWALVRDCRDHAEWAGCTTQMGRADSDPDSQRKIGGAVQMAMLTAQAGQPFTIDWTMQDNSTVTHDAAAMIAMGLAVGQHITACHAVALEKRAAIEAADTVEAIEAIDPTTGWPDPATP